MGKSRTTDAEYAEKAADYETVPPKAAEVPRSLSIPPPTCRRASVQGQERENRFVGTGVQRRPSNKDTGVSRKWS